MMRTFFDGKIVSTPSEEALAQLREEQPDTKVKILVEPGATLSELRMQDSYSYEIADVFVGGRDRMDLLEKYARACELLSFEIDYGKEVVPAG
jgi:hypothetical protein